MVFDKHSLAIQISHLCKNYILERLDSTEVCTFVFKNTNKIEFYNDYIQLYILNKNFVKISYDKILLCAVTYLPMIHDSLMFFVNNYREMENSHIVHFPIENSGKSKINYICQHPVEECQYRLINGYCKADLTCGYETINGVNTFVHGSMIDDKLPI